MKKFILLFFPLVIFNLHVFAQDSIQVQRNTLNDQMVEVFEKSNSYQEYKVIKKTDLAKLKKNILDSIGALKEKINTQETDLRQQRIALDSLGENLRLTKENLERSQEKENGIEVLGILTSKGTYNAIMWTIILVLLLAGGFLFYRFLNSHKITNAAELKIAEMEIELEEQKRKSLEREQKLRRKLQDELNKNKKA